ncbi:hypothetical protein HDU67_001337 [Dinochytrium kinnereticum]|nr:hypothetical protein HDU67_001337 [Dinochytrium kinnereticum]
MTINVTVLGGLHWDDANTNLVLDPSWRAPENEEKGVSVLAVPALFGPVLKSAGFVPLLILDVDACDPFTIILPNVVGVSDFDFETSDASSTRRKHDTNKKTSARVNATLSENSTSVISQRKSRLHQNSGGFPASSEEIPKDPAFAMYPTTKPSKWFALIPRGNCPFDTKIYNAQQAGFSGAIVYNNGSFTSPDIPVRMSPNYVGDQVTVTTAMYMTHFDSAKLIKASWNFDRHFASPLLVHAAPDVWPATGWGRKGTEEIPAGLTNFVVSAISDAVVLIGSVLIVGLVLTSFYFLITTIRSFFSIVMEYRHAGSQFEIDDVVGVEEETAELLEKVTLPIRIVKVEDLEVERKMENGGEEEADNHGMATGGSRECCAICIDEFVVGSKVRQLPCRHQFHDICAHVVHHN